MQRTVAVGVTGNGTCPGPTSIPSPERWDAKRRLTARKCRVAWLSLSFQCHRAPFRDSTQLMDYVGVSGAAFAVAYAATFRLIASCELP